MCIILLSFFTKVAQCMKNWIFERCANTQHICAVFAVSQGARGAEGKELDRTRGGSGKTWGSSWSLQDANCQAALGKAKVQPCYCKTRKKTSFTLELHIPWRTNSCEYSFQYQRHVSNTLAGCYHHGIHANSCGASTTIAQLFKLFLPSVQLG